MRLQQTKCVYNKPNASTTNQMHQQQKKQILGSPEQARDQK